MNSEEYESNEQSEQADACPICLSAFTLKTLVANPNECKHIFCPECIKEWSKKTNTCPVDRKEFVSIRIKRLICIQPALQFSKCLRTIPVDKKTINEPDEDVTYCQICGRSDREETLLLCDDCDNGFHCECLNPRLHEIPEGFWFCDGCIERRERLTMGTSDPVQDVVNAIAESAAHATPTRPRPVARRRKVVKRRKVKRKRKVIRKSFAKNTSKKYTKIRRRKKPVVRKQRKLARKPTIIETMPIEAPILVDLFSKKQKAPADRISDIKSINFGNDKAWFMLNNIMNEVPITSEEVKKEPIAVPVKKEPSNSVLLLDKILEEQSKLFGKPKLLTTFKTPEKVPIQTKTSLSSNSASFNRHFKPQESNKPCTSGLTSFKISSQQKPQDKKTETKHEKSTQSITISSKLTPNPSDSKPIVQHKSSHESHHSSSSSVKPSTSTGLSLNEIQDRIVEIAKKEIKSYYMERKISKDQYKIVMKKVVKLALRDSERQFGSAQEAKVRGMVHHYVKKFF